MRLFRKIIKIVVIFLIILIAGGILLVRNISRRALPDYDGQFAIEGLEGDVLVLRDPHAVPSVYAANENDLYRAVGFVMAQDRLWQMDLLRRATTGRLSEIFGEDLVETDYLLRALRIPEKSTMVLAETDSNILNALESFAYGVNQFIEQAGNNLPPEFGILRYRPEKWEPVHSVNLIGYMAWDLNMGWTTEVVLHKLKQVLDEERFSELIPHLELHTSKIYPEGLLAKNEIRERLLEPTARLHELGLAVVSGSNNWAVSGEKSTTGKPILASDAHLGLFAPGIWYQMQHVVEGGVQVTGVVLPGQPFVIAGHNERIAWGMTNVMLDDVDFYKETINPDNQDQYLFQGQWRDMEVRVEEIKTGSAAFVERELRFTHRGPVISGLKDIEEEAISMRWTGNEYSNELRSVYLLNRAGNWHEFREAVSTFMSVSQNINYADVDGNIGLQTAAGIPVREGEGVFILPGEDDKYDWRGMVPFGELPFVYNPPEGFVVSANNRTVPDDYPYYISYWYDQPYRYDRIREMLMEKEKFSTGDFKDMLADKESKLAKKMVPVLLEELKEMAQPTVNERRAAEMLAGWDLVYSADEPAPLIFETFYNHFLENLLLYDMGEELYEEFTGSKVLVRSIMDLVWTKRESAWLEGDKQYTGPGSFRDVVHTSFSQSVAWIEQNLGPYPDRWAWGDVHRLTISHPMGAVTIIDRLFNLNRGPYSPGGSFHTVCPYSYNYTNPYVINHGASQRHIYSTADWNSSFSIIPTGTSGIPASRYYGDQTEMYVGDMYRSDVFTREAVEDRSRYRMTLVPPGN